MPGAQEILIIAAIVGGIIIIPRLMNPKKPAPKLVRPAKRLSGKIRIAVAASILYPLLAAAILQPWRKDPAAWLFIGLGPIILGWLLIWVMQGYRRP